jgi:ribosomal protein L16 Arg81 hydroxylase
MPESDVSFRHLIAPVIPEEFFREVWGQRPLHITGAPDKFASLFSWGEFNRLLNMSKLWSDRSMKVVLDGRNLEPEEFGVPGHTREGNPANLLDPDKVTGLLQRGATVVLDLIETLSPGVAAIAGALQSATGGVAVCNAYCSWSAHQAFPAHFDTTDVIAVHFEGTKVWRIYEGRADQPVDVEGYNFGSFTPEHHARAKGKLITEIEMRPGHVLYLPRGQYHEALASSEASLHLSFGLNQATGIDVINRLAGSLVEEELFRRELPHFDRPNQHRDHMRALADRLRGLLSQESLSDQIRDWQRGRALRDGYSRFRLPAREGTVLYRVRSLGLVVEPSGEAVALKYPGGELVISAEEKTPAAWILAHDYFVVGELMERFDSLGEDVLVSLLERLEASSVLDRM